MGRLWISSGRGVGLFLAVSWLASAQPAPSPLPEQIPIFPLQDVMLFPNAVRPLHIFEPRYREMILHALAGDRVIGMVMLEPGHESEYYGRPPIYPIGCAGVIAKVEELPDGRYNILLRGLSKFRVKREDRSRSFRIAEVETIPETLTDDERQVLRELRPRLLELLSDIVPAGQQPTPEEVPDEELVDGLAQFLGMESHDRLSLLERTNPLERAEALIALMEP